MTPSRRALGLSVFNAMARNGGALDSMPIDWLAMARVSTLRTVLDAFADDVGSPSGADVYARVGYGDPDRLRLTANLLWARDELDIHRDALGEEAQSSKAAAATSGCAPTTPGARSCSAASGSGSAT